MNAKRILLKAIRLLIFVSTFSISGYSQTIFDPSGADGYIQFKESLIIPSPPVQQSLKCDAADYHPGSIANFKGKGFVPHELVTIQILHEDGTPTKGAANHSCKAKVDAKGAFTAQWKVCNNDCVGEHLIAKAQQKESGLHAETGFTDWNSGSICWIEYDSTYINFPGNDDNSIGFNIPFSFNLYGSTYNYIYINNNGNLTFTAPYSAFNATGFPFNVPMVAGFWADIDTRNNHGKVEIKVDSTHAIITYSQVGYFGGQLVALRNTFQIIISNGNDTLIGVGNNVCFRYLDMQWTTAQSSGGLNGFGGIPATVGINKGDGVNFVQVGRFNLNSGVYDGGGGNNDGINYLDNGCFCFNVSNALNQPPSVSGVPANNTFEVECGTTQTISLSFLPPEVIQTVLSTVNTGGLCNTTTTTTSGAFSVANVTITGDSCNKGLHVISFAATDNFSPPASTLVNINVNIVDHTKPTIACPGNIVVGNDQALCGAQVSYVVTYNDCSPVTLTQINGLTSGAVFPIGTTTNVFVATDNEGNSDTCSFDVTVNSSLTVDAGIDEQTYFGFVLDQTVSHTAIVAGGTGPYTYAWTLSRPLLCNVVTPGGDETFSGGSCINNICPTLGGGVVSPSCSGDATITTTLLQDADVCVTVTDSAGCTASACFHITAEDVRCCSGTTKVKVCHHTGNSNNPFVELCMLQSSVASYLNTHPNDYVGICSSRLEATIANKTSEITIYPNPVKNLLNVDFESDSQQTCNIKVAEMTGRVVYSEDITASEGKHHLEVNISRLAPGMYLLDFQMENTNEQIRVVVE